MPNNQQKEAMLPMVKKNKPLNNIQTITCQCGAEILVLPDTEAMSQAIEKHIELHRAEDKTLSMEELDCIRDDLIAKIFKKISE
jgi:hypothetical protein